MYMFSDKISSRLNLDCTFGGIWPMSKLQWNQYIERFLMDPLYMPIFAIIVIIIYKYVRWRDGEYTFTHICLDAHFWSKLRASGFSCSCTIPSMKVEWNFRDA